MISLQCDSFEVRRHNINAFSRSPTTTPRYVIEGMVRLHPGCKRVVNVGDNAVVALELDGKIICLVVRVKPGVIERNYENDDLLFVSFIGDGFPFGSFGIDTNEWIVSGMDAVIYVP